MSKRRPSAGFTVGEFGMVVLLFVALIASFCLFGLRGTEKARQAACVSNLKQLGMAAAMYASDNTGCYPGSRATAAMLPYTKNQQILSCPARKSEADSSYLNREVPLDEELLWMQAEPGMIHRVDYYFSPGLRSDDRPGTIFAYDNVPDAHSSRTFNFVRLDGAAGSLPAAHWPGVPEPPKEAADDQ